MQYPVLALPTEKGEYVLDTDASDVAIAGILHQYQPYEGEMKSRVIAYASRTLNDCQRKYGAAAKLEMFAALKMIEKFSPYLCLGKFKSPSGLLRALLAKDVRNTRKLDGREMDHSPGRVLL